MSASKFRDVTNNGTVSSSDDFKKKKQCFLVQLLKIKFIGGGGEAWQAFFFFLRKKKGLFSSSPSFLSKQEREMACWRAWQDHLENHPLLILRSFSDFFFFIIHAYMQIKYIRNC